MLVNGARRVVLGGSSALADVVVTLSSVVLEDMLIMIYVFSQKVFCGFAVK
jgi:hypothetical protein